MSTLHERLDRARGVTTEPAPPTLTPDGEVVCPNREEPGDYHPVELFEYVERSWSVAHDGTNTLIADAGTDEVRWESSHPQGYGLICRGCLWEYPLPDENRLEFH